ncbi:MAG TPA: hypothetical protein VN238_18365 [Solirubrobacteraceae bacterium]|nr:hypothetical protein [Solirubrobacteraceae bacterium]
MTRFRTFTAADTVTAADLNGIQDDYALTLSAWRPLLHRWATVSNSATVAAVAPAFRLKAADLTPPTAGVRRRVPEMRLTYQWWVVGGSTHETTLDARLVVPEFRLVDRPQSPIITNPTETMLARSAWTGTAAGSTSGVVVGDAFPCPQDATAVVAGSCGRNGGFTGAAHFAITLEYRLA